MAAQAPAAANAVPAVPRGEQRGAQEQQGGGIASTIKQVVMTIVVVQLVQAAFKGYMGTKEGAQTVPDLVPDAASNPGAAAATAARAGAKGTPQPPNMLPLWSKGTPFDAHMFITATGHHHINIANPSFPHVVFENLTFGDWTWKQEWNTEVQLPTAVQQNGTLYLDTFFARDNSPIDYSAPGFKAENVYHLRTPLMKYQRQVRIRAERNLLSSSAATTEDAKAEVEETAEEAKAKDNAMPIVPYYHPNITLAVVSNSGPMPEMQPEPISRHIRSIPPASGTINPRYYPIVYPNTFWQLKTQSFPVNTTVASVPLNVRLEPMSATKFQIFATMDESFAQAANNPMGGGAGAAEFDEVKRVLLETNIYLLATTVIVTILHTLFEFLAFSSDVKHWRNTKSQVGVSLRTIITNIIVQLIITLYLFDNNQDTSIMILFGQGTGLLIECWKITKAVDIKLVKRPVNDSALIPYKIEIKDKHVLSKEEQETKEYDALAFKWVLWGTTPLLVGYTIYSLLYQSHRGWYSFVINTLTSFVYAFGFIQLVPQLIINYKLQSVAHMPMKSLTYKALNTVVDDFFSFVISMPFLHRLACFRDDVVFVILLWQMWRYRVDPKRANEYGQVLDEKISHPDSSTKVKEDAKAGAVEESKKDK